MRDIFIYGEVVPSFISGWDGCINLKDVIGQLEKAEGEDLRVRVNCVGGDVNEGFAIYAELRRYAQKHGATITTLAEGYCASIATVIFLAGDKRIVNEFTEPFVHNAWTYAVGDAKGFTKVAADLESCNDVIAKHYEGHTDLTYDEARALMDADTSISADDCVAYRFAHEIEYTVKPVNSILKNRVNFKNPNTMSNKNQKRGFKASILGALGLLNKILFDAENREVDFYDLSDDQEVAVGDKAKVDGKPAAEASPTGDGKIVMQSGETYVFEGEELKEIIAKEDPDTGAEDPLTVEEQEALVAAVAKLNSQVKDLKAKLETAEQKVNDYEALEAKLAKFENPANRKKGPEGSKFAAAVKNLTEK